MTKMRQNKEDVYRWSKIRVPECNGDNRWHSYITQFNTIMKMNDCRDNDVMVCKLVEALRGRALIILRVYLVSFALNLLPCIILLKVDLGGRSRNSLCGVAGEG